MGGSNVELTVDGTLEPPCICLEAEGQDLLDDRLPILENFLNTIVEELQMVHHDAWLAYQEADGNGQSDLQRLNRLVAAIEFFVFRCFACSPNPRILWSPGVEQSSNFVSLSTKV